MFDKKKKEVRLPDLPEKLQLDSPTINDYKDLPDSTEEYNDLPKGEELPEEHEMHNLPSFPNSPKNHDFSQAAIKEAVDTENELSLPPLPQFYDEDHKEESEFPRNPQNEMPQQEKKYKVIEMEEWTPRTESMSSKSNYRPAPLMQRPSEFELPDESEIYNEESTPRSSMPLLHEIEEDHPPHFSMANPQSMSHKANTGRQVFVKLNKFQSARDSLSIIQDKLSEIDELLKKIREVKAEEDDEIILWEKEIDAIKTRVKAINSDIFETAYIC